MANCLDHLRSLLDHASDLIQVMTPDGQIIYANQAWCRVLGYQQAEVPTLSFFDLLQPDSRDRIQQILFPLQTNTSNRDMEATLRAKNGHAILVKGRICYNENRGSPEIWSLWQRAASLQAFPSPTQAPHNLSQTSLQQQQVQEALQQSEDRYRTVVAALQEGVVLLDGEGRICTCNASAERILGLSAEQLSGLNSFDLSWNTISEDGSPFLAEMHPVFLTLRTGKPYSNVIMGIYKPDGGLAWVSVNSQPLFRSGETVPYGVVASFSDITSRKQAEEALRRSERRYRAIVEDQTELVCRFLPDGTLTFANEAYCQLFGISQEELVRHSYKMFLLALDKETEAHLTAAANPEKPVSWLEHQVILPNGEVRWQRWSNRAIFDDCGRCVEFQAVGRDITAWKRLEESLIASEAKLSDILHNAGAAIVRFRLFANLRFQYEFYSQGSEVIFGYSVEELMQEDGLWISCLHPDDFEARVLPAFNRIYEEHPITVEYRFRQKDGSWRWISETSISKRDEEADCWVVTCVATDITNRKRAERELQEISTALSNAVEGISQLNALGHYVKVNQAYANAMGYSPEELIGQSWQITVYPEDLNRLTTAYQQMVDTGKAEVETRGQRKDGTFFYKQVFMLAIYNEQRQFTGHYCFMKDISDRKRAEAEIVKALEKEKELNELKSRFVSMISHEFRTPLTTIQSATELLEYYEWSQAEKRERFQQIHIAVQHMTQLLEDVLLIGRVEAGKLGFNPSLIDLTAFCRQLVAETQLTTDHKYCITFNSQEQAQNTWIDQKLLRQILTNLLSNAIKYSPNGGNIELGLNYGTNIIQLWVKDEGIGIPPEAREHVFEAFFRAKNVSTIQGTGLGLAIVKKCVELHKGTIRLESEVGAGTTFIITLPGVVDCEDKKGAG
ncbi:PAS domain-containing sensor histidine kinase [Leptothermofonsia sp. ETS-13]|uniref:sensor histidine kinase n=1 Tax=Leptothermofonsia sp. ETS-13 TaxID=3035696 RepID=UPI003BA09A4F